MQTYEDDDASNSGNSCREHDGMNSKRAAAGEFGDEDNVGGDDGDSPMGMDDNEGNDDQGHVSRSSSMTSTPSTTTSSTPPFQLNQRVLCCDTSNQQRDAIALSKTSAQNLRYYPAVVRKAKVEGLGWKYQVHFQGWNSRWDRWVHSDALQEDTDENRALYLTDASKKDQQTETQNDENMQTSNTTKGSASNTASTFTSPSRKRKPGSGSSSSKRTPKRRTGGNASSSSMSASSSLHSLWRDYCELPFTLKTIMVEDYEAITRKGHGPLPHTYDEYDAKTSLQPVRKVHDLPANVTVRQVLQQYQKKRGGSKASPEKQVQIQNFCQGIRELFDSSLPTCLLYPEERPQYQHVAQKYFATNENAMNGSMSSQPNKTACDVYGCTFLLRLFVRLPVLLSESSMAFLDTSQNSGNHYSAIDSQSGRFIDPSESISNEVQVIGPLIMDLIVLLQKNHNACFARSYRQPKTSELMDLEVQQRESEQSSTSL